MKAETDSLIEQYLQQAHQLMLDMTVGEATEDDLLQLIDERLREVPEVSPSAAFFYAERAFHTQQYKEALRNYLHATEVPSHRFLCYRASAFLAAQLGQTEKALEFAKKALALQHNDIDTLRLCKELGSTPDATAYGDPERLEPVSLAEEEFNALASIFQSDESNDSPMPPTDPIEQEDEELMDFGQTAESPIATTHFVDPVDALQSRIHCFNESQRKQLADYIDRSQQRSRCADRVLYVLNGWGEREEDVWMSQGERQSQGGYYLRWNGTGIVINPGKHFLRHFHQQGLNLRDIDCVIVTSAHPESYADVTAIYDFNNRLNHYQSQLHVIQYYLNRCAYQELAPRLKPNFKQEANSVHSLELYVDSPDSESVALSDLAVLNYFLTSSKESRSGSRGVEEASRRGDKPQLGIWLDLRAPLADSSLSSLRIGYVSGTAWSPLLSSHLSGCDLLIAGVENSGPNDYQKQVYNEASLGYYGAFSLFEEVLPQLMICCEFGGREGDIRLELVQKMRQEPVSARKGVILPGDNGLRIDLSSLSAYCSVTGSTVDPSRVRVAKSRESFGVLQYLSPDCVI